MHPAAFLLPWGPFLGFGRGGSFRCALFFEEELMEIFIRNLPYSVTRDEIHACLEQWGEVSYVRAPCDETGSFRGFAFIGMNDEDALLAIEELNGREWGGRRIDAARAKPRK